MTAAGDNSLFIAGQWQAGQGDMMASYNPADDSLLWQKPQATAPQVSAAVASAREAQKHWALLPLSERVAALEAFADLLRAEAGSMALAIARETGKPDWEAATEVTAMANKVAISARAQAERAGEWQRDRLQLGHRPHGVMAVFGPYNFPGHLPNGHIVPALLAGNTVVFKPSEQTPWVAELTVALWQRAGLPAGVLNLVQGGREVGEALAGADIDGLLFTGSSRVGRLLHSQLAGRPEVLLALEMGGNNPLIVDGDINVEAAVQIIAQSAWLSAGQRCTCARRLVLVDSVASDDVLMRLQDLASRIIVDRHDAQPEPFMGPVINGATARALLAEEARLASSGAAILASMAPRQAGSNFLRPGLVDVTSLAEQADTEWFGPMLQVHRVATFEQALTVANATRYGLAAGLISDQADHQERFRAQIRAGVVSLNAPTAGASSELPFGGIGASGNHRPSAWYAADYCAWPQACTVGAATHQQDNTLTRGLR